MADLSLDLCGVKLKNPIIAASGTFGFGREYDELYDIGQLGGISVKGLSLLPRTGNPPSRIAETPSGMLNSVGLQNPGVESFIENDLPWLLTKNVAVIANITGTSVEQYVQMAERLAGTGVHLLEMNISCPNVHEGGVAFGVKPESVYAITKAVKAAAKQPLIVKLTPNVSDITENALAAEEAGADAISMINTLTGIAVDVNKRRMVLANNTGGLSGPAVRPVALRMVWQSAKKVHIPIIGMEPALKVACDRGDVPSDPHHIPQRVIVAATPLTLRERKFAKLMDRFDSNNTIFKEPCPDLVEIVESGRLGDHDLVMRTLHGYFDQYDMEHIDSVVLGCTHFVFYRDYFLELLPERAAVIDGNEGTVRHLGVVLESLGKLAPEDATGGVELANSDPSERIAELSRKLLNV